MDIIFILKILLIAVDVVLLIYGLALGITGTSILKSMDKVSRSRIKLEKELGTYGKQGK